MSKIDPQKAQEALILAGKLAMASENLVNSNLLFLSENIKNLKKELDNYNDFIFNWARAK